MPQTITLGEQTLAVLAPASEAKHGSEWFGVQTEALQAQRVVATKEKYFKPHQHILNPRIIQRTQEAFIVISGRIAVDVYDKPGNLIGTLEAGPGDLVICYRGGHGIRVLEDGMFYEAKAGHYSYVSDDKEFYASSI